MNFARALDDIAEPARPISHTRAALARDTIYMPSELAARLLSATLTATTRRSIRTSAWCGTLRRWVEVVDRRSVEHLAVRIEARSVAGTIPALLRGVPVDDALHVRARGRALVHAPRLVPVDGDLVRAAPDDAALARRDRRDVVDLAGRDVVAEL